LENPKGIRVLANRPLPLWANTRLGWGRLCLLASALGIIGAGLTISVVGMTVVFVPQDLTFMGVTVEFLHSVNPRLVPLIAHDRAGFGGGLCSGGIALFCSIWSSPPSRSLWQILALVGGVGFASAIGIHFVIGYEDAMHLAPACLGAAFYGLGLVLSARPMLTR
jgi:hypothetical protein